MNSTRWRLRLRSLRHWRVQTVLTVLALGASVALPVVLLSVGGGVYQRELNSLAQSGFQVSVTTTGTHGVANAHALAGRIDRLPHVAAASPVLSVPVDLYFGISGPVPVLAEGVLPAAFLATQGPAERTLLPSNFSLGDPTDLIHYANGTYAGPASNDLLLSTPLAATVGASSGGSVLLSPSPNRSAGSAFLVEGLFGLPPTLLGPSALFVALLPLSDLQVLVGLARSPGGALLDDADSVQVAVSGSAAAQPGTISALAQSIQGLVPYYSVTSLTEEASSLRTANAVLTGFYFGLSSVALSVGLLFLVIVLLRRVELERRAIGIRRAIGVSAWMIARELAVEAVLLASGGVVVGIVAGILTLRAMAAYGSPLVREAASLALFDPTTLVLLAVVLLLIAAVASLLPSRRALRLSIPEALR